MAKTGMTYKIDKRVLDQLVNTTPAGLDRIGRSAAQEITNEIVLSFGTGSAGRRYPRGSSGKRYHVASAPGGPPAIDTGTLRASMRWERNGKLSYRIMDGVEYGYMLENGTPKMAARPFVGPVMSSWARGKLEALVKDIFF